MSYNKKNRILFAPSGCLTDEAIQYYVFRKIDQDSKRKIENHLNSCKLCRDAVDGIQSISENKYKHSISGIQNKIEQKYIFEESRGNSRSVLIKRIIYYAAASVILIIAFINYLKPENKKEHFNKNRLLGETIMLNDTLTYFNILGETEDMINKEMDLSGMETKNSMPSKQNLKEVKVYKNDEVYHINDATPQLFLVKNDMIIRENKPPELLQSIKYPFKVFISKKIDSLLYTTTMPKKYDITASFVISKEGFVKHPMILSSSNSSVDSFTVKILEHSPKWKPATINNTPVDYPVKIKISNY